MVRLNARISKPVIPASSLARMLPRCIVLLGLLCACTEDPPAPPIAETPVHLIDRWEQAVRLESGLTDLVVSPPIEVSVRDVDQVGGLPAVELPWPARVTTLSVASGNEELARCTSLAELADRSGYLLMPRRRHWEGEHLKVSDDPRDRARPYAGIRAGESLEWTVDSVGGPVMLALRVRSFRPAPVELTVLVDDQPAGVVPEIGIEWREFPLELTLKPGANRLSIEARDPEGRRKEGWLLLLDWIDLVNEHPETVVLGTRTDTTSTRIRYQGLPPSPEQELEVNHGEVAVLAAGGPLLVHDAAGNVVHESAHAEAGLHRIKVNGTGTVHVRQPMATVLPYLSNADARLHDDVQRDSRDTGVLDEEVAGRVLSRLESHHDRRGALLLPTPSNLAFECEWPSDAVLRFAVGVADPLGETRLDGARRTWDDPVRFRVRWIPEGEDGQWIDEVSVHESGWQDREVTLSTELTGPGTLTFVTDGQTGHPSAFADPRFVPTRSRERQQPNVIFYLVDTLRADRLGCYGGPNPTSPTLDELARDGFLLKRFNAIAAHTRPSTATAMTGLLPTYHSVFGLDHSLPFSVTTMAELMRDAGYSCWAFVSSNQIAGRGLHFEQGFHRFVAPLGVTATDPDAPTSRAINETSFPWLAANGDEPFFLYLHSLDPHTPYESPPGYSGRFDPDYDGFLRDRDLGRLDPIADQLEERDLEYLRNVYDEQIRYQDDQLKALRDHLRDHGILDDTIVVLFSDHGEEFAEHGGFYHGGRMWQELIHVPCVVWMPPRWCEKLGVTPGKIDTRTSLVDLVPTLVDLLGLEAPPTWQGRSFASDMRGTPEPEVPFLGEDREGIGCVIQGDQKLIWFDRRGKMERQYGLFDLGTDPGETQNLIAQHPDRAEKLKQLVEQLHREFERRGFQAGSSETVELDQEALEQLRALGYLEDDSN